MSRVTGTRRAIAAIMAAGLVYVIARWLLGTDLAWEDAKLVIVATGISAIVTRWMHTKGESFLKTIGI